MKLLVIIPGTPVDDATATTKDCIDLDTLTEGRKKFLNVELLNNLQSIAALRATGKFEIDIKSFSRRRTPLQLIKSGKAIRSYTQKEKPDAVYIYWGGLSAWITTQYSFSPVIVCLLGSDLMGTYSSDGSKTKFGRLLSYFSHRACREAKAVVVMSQKMKGLLSHYCQQKTLVLPEGVDLEKFYPMDKLEARKALGWDEKHPIILFFNSGAYVKNAPLAYKAMEFVKEDRPEARLVEVNNVSHQELLHYYNAADLLLLTSFHEGSNNSIKEALACNCPIVSTDVGDASEILKGVHPSAVVHGFHAEEMAKRMLEILQSPVRSNGRISAEKVSVQNVADNLSQYLYQTLGSNTLSIH